MSMTDKATTKIKLRKQVAQYIDGLVTGYAKANRCDEITAEAQVKQALIIQANQMG